jgi:hypothetical protein
VLSKDRPDVRVDLSGLTFVDDAGKACLAAMYHEGADFIADDCLTKSIVEEISQERDGREMTDSMQTTLSQTDAAPAPAASENRLENS